MFYNKTQNYMFFSYKHTSLQHTLFSPLPSRSKDKIYVLGAYTGIWACGMGDRNITDGPEILYRGRGIGNCHLNIRYVEEMECLEQP